MWHDMLKIVKKWYSALRQKLVMMRNNAGFNHIPRLCGLVRVNGSQKLLSIFQKLLSTFHEQRQSGLTEEEINSIVIVSGTIIMASGLCNRS